jgi:hypothetical protein
MTPSHLELDSGQWVVASTQESETSIQDERVSCLLSFFRQD